MSKTLKKAKKHMALIKPAPTMFERIEMLPLFTDMTCGLKSGSSLWESMYNMLIDEKPRKIQRKATVDAPDSSEATIGDVANSFLH